MATTSTTLTLGPTSESSSGNFQIITMIPTLYTGTTHLTPDKLINKITFSLPLYSSTNASYNISGVIFRRFDLNTISASWSNSGSSGTWAFRNESGTNCAYYYSNSAGWGDYGLHNGNRATGATASTVAKLFPELFNGTSNESVLAHFSVSDYYFSTRNQILTERDIDSLTIIKSNTTDWTWSSNDNGYQIGIALYETEGYYWKSSSDTTRNNLRWQPQQSFNVTLTLSDKGIIRYNNNGEWVNCIPYYYDNGWKQCIPYYRDGSNWKQLG